MKQASEKNKVAKGGAISSAFIVVKNFLKKQAKTKLGKALQVLLLALGLIACGFFTGRKTINYEPLPPEIVYLPGEPIEVPGEAPDPVYIKVPADTADIIADCVKSGKFKELFPTIVKDSIVYLTKEDSSAVIKDWATERFYSEKVFDVDTVGTAVVAAKTQYNRLEILGTTFVPVQKQVTINNVVAKKYAPFVEAGITTMPSYFVSGGVMFEDKYGASLILQRDWERKKNSVGLKLTYKF